jgi:hypothetical protein
VWVCQVILEEWLIWIDWSELIGKAYLGIGRFYLMIPIPYIVKPLWVGMAHRQQHQYQPYDN